jgi:hypothetical protein
VIQRRKYCNLNSGATPLRKLIFYIEVRTNIVTTAGGNEQTGRNHARYIIIK